MTAQYLLLRPACIICLPFVLGPALLLTGLACTAYAAAKGPNLDCVRLQQLHLDNCEFACIFSLQFLEFLEVIYWPSSSDYDGVFLCQNLQRQQAARC